jgi:hypothetical protein
MSAKLMEMIATILAITAYNVISQVEKVRGVLMWPAQLRITY